MWEKEQNSKIIWNAVSAYFMIFVSGMFLFNKQNPLLNNSFVKKHTKSALIIHLGFLLSYLIFISYGIGSNISIWSFALNYIIASSLCIFFLWMMLFAISKASKGEIFAIWEIIRVAKVKKMIDVENNQTNWNEREKLDILLSYIPFVSFYIAATKQKENLFILHASRGTLFITVILILLYNFHHTNIVIFLILLYLIYVVFIWLNIFTTWNIFQIRYANVFSPEYKFEYTQALSRYLKNYIRWNDLQKMSHYQEEIRKENDRSLMIENDRILSLPDLKLPKSAIYIPILNLGYLFLKENKYSTHIRNGLVISVLFIIIFFLLKFTTLNYGFLYLFWIVALYWIGYIHTQPVYKMPYIYIFYTLFQKIFGKTKEANAKYNVEKNITLKVWEK